MRFYWFLVCLFGLALVGLVLRASAQERITLTSGEIATTNLKYRLERLIIEEDDPDTAGVNEAAIIIQIIGIERRVQRSCVYNAGTSPTATTLINGLNTANLSSTYNNNATTGSLKQRIFHRLAVMGEGPTVCGVTVAGTVTGTPQ